MLSVSANHPGNNITLTWDVTGKRNVIRYKLEYNINTTNFMLHTSVSYRKAIIGTNTYSYTHLPAVSNSIILYQVIPYKADGSKSNQIVVRLNDKNTP